MLHQAKLKINDREVLSPQHFNMKLNGKQGSVVESQIPLDIKLQITSYDENEKHNEEF